MKYEKLASQRISQLFEINEIKLIAISTNYEKYASSKIIITLTYDNIENIFSIYLGNSEDVIHLNGEIITSFFNISIDDYFIVPEKNWNDFENNTFVFFNTFGFDLFHNKSNILDKLIFYCREKDKKYTEKIIFEQNLVLANSAWNDKKYSEFISIINDTDISLLPSSYKLKYKIAKQKLLG